MTNKAHEFVKEMSQKLGNKFYTWLEQHGREMSTPTFRVSDLGFTPHSQQCYANSQRLLCYRDWKGVKYFEGYATTKAMGDMAFEHGWNTIDGKVVDLTWEDGVDYFGIEISPDLVRTRWLKTGKAESLLILLYREKT